jgi:hypothetical protein
MMAMWSIFIVSVLAAVGGLVGMVFIFTAESKPPKPSDQLSFRQALREAKEEASAQDERTFGLVVCLGLIAFAVTGLLFSGLAIWGNG